MDTKPREHGLNAVEEAAAPQLSELLHRGRPGFVEVVAATRSAGGRLIAFERGNFVRAGRKDELRAALGRLAGGRGVELFFTPATLTRPVSGNEAVTGLSVAWVDIDDPTRLADLGRFPHRPHAVVASGSGGAPCSSSSASPKIAVSFAASLGRGLECRYRSVVVSDEWPIISLTATRSKRRIARLPKVRRRSWKRRTRRLALFCARMKRWRIPDRRAARRPGDRRRSRRAR
jgi:hypothetical protein